MLEIDLSKRITSEEVLRNKLFENSSVEKDEEENLISSLRRN